MGNNTLRIITSLSFLWKWLVDFPDAAALGRCHDETTAKEERGEVVWYGAAACLAG
jgi:hypothetical protein